MRSRTRPKQTRFLSLATLLLWSPRHVLKRAKNLGEPASILEAIVATDYHSIVGPIKWSGKPVKNISKTPLVAGQWRKSDNGIELVICEDATAPNIKSQAKLRLLS